MPYVEHDVSADPAAAQEMVRRSGQMGVPVLVADGEVIVGFDRPRLERILARRAAGPAAETRGIKLGLLVRDAQGRVEVGGTRPGSLAERLGARGGDVVEQLAGQPIRSVADLERVARSLMADQPVDLVVRRAGQTLRLSAPAA